MTGRLGECLLLAYRTPAKTVETLLPDGLELMTEGPWAFWNIVICRVENIRPLGLPGWCGLTYHHIGYRLYVRARLTDRAETKGLFFVRSDADNAIICHPGNFLTDFRFHRAEIKLSNTNDEWHCAAQSKDAHGNAHLKARRGSLDSDSSQESCFSSTQRREKALKYNPEALSTDRSGRFLKIASVHRDESHWREEPVTVVHSHWRFLESLDQHAIFLERATRVAPIDYGWSLYRRVKIG